MRSRGWCFTINNPTDDERATLSILPENAEARGISHLVFQLERGDRGTPHYQGYIRFTNPRLLAGVKRVLGRRAHVERARGTLQHNHAYCTKPETRVEGPWEVGDFSITQGRRTDILEALEERTIQKVIEEHPQVYVKFHRGLEKVFAHRRKIALGSMRPVCVTVLWGPTGTGKTYRVFREFGASVYRHDLSGNAEWWDGYVGQSTILFDDFYGQRKCSRMLHLLDGYPLDLPVKGGFTPAAYTAIYITSNTDPERWYQGVPREQRLALRRRLRHIIHVRSRDQQILGLLGRPSTAPDDSGSPGSDRPIEETIEDGH